MVQVSSSIWIAASPEAVFDFVANVPRIPEFVGIVREVFDVSHDPVVVGSTYRERVRLGPFTVGQQWEVVELERPRRQVYDGGGPGLSVLLSKFMEPEGAGARYRQTMDLTFIPKAPWLGRMVAPLGARAFQRESERIVAGIKRIVERERAVPHVR